MMGVIILRREEGRRLLTSFFGPTSHFLYKGEQIYDFVVTIMSNKGLMSNDQRKTMRWCCFYCNYYDVAYPIEVYFVLLASIISNVLITIYV